MAQVHGHVFPELAKRVRERGLGADRLVTIDAGRADHELSLGGWAGTTSASIAGSAAPARTAATCVRSSGCGASRCMSVWKMASISGCIMRLRLWLLVVICGPMVLVHPGDSLVSLPGPLRSQAMGLSCLAAISA